MVFGSVAAVPENILYAQSQRPYHSSKHVHVHELAYFDVNFSIWLSCPVPWWRHYWPLENVIRHRVKGDRHAQEVSLHAYVYSVR